jgi:hypothetical protein
MTRIQFLEKVLQIVSTRGRSYPTEDDTDDQNTLLNARLYAFTQRTRCLYSDQVTIDLVINQPTYSLMTAFKLGAAVQPMIELESFIVNTCEMQLLTFEEFRALAPTYKTDAASVPTIYCYLPGSESGEDGFRVYATPVANYAACPVSGWMGHPQIDVSTAGDATKISVPIDHLETAAVFCAVGFLYPNQASVDDIQIMATLDRSAASSMADLESRARQILRGPQIRGYGVNRGYSRNIQL